MASSALTVLDRKILLRLKDGPVWRRSLQTFKPLVERLVNSGHVQAVHPPGGKCANMVGLSVKGANLIGVEPPSSSMLDRLAVRLAEHGDVSLAAREIGTSPEYGRVLFQRIKKQLGWQAQ